MIFCQAGSLVQRTVLSLKSALKFDRHTGMLFKVLEVVRHAQAGMPVCMLREQYRMHPCISAWPSSFFYEGLLVDAPSVQGQGRAAPFHKDGCFPPLAFFDCRCVQCVMHCSLDVSMLRARAQRLLPQGWLLSAPGIV